MGPLDLIQPVYSSAGFAVGFLVGLTGVGGGSLMTPLLILVFGIHPSVAVGTDLLYAAITKAAGTAVHNFNGSVDWHIVGRLTIGSVPATAISLVMLSHIGIESKSAHLLITTVLALAVFLTALTLIFRSKIMERYSLHLQRISPANIRNLTVCLGAAVGVLVSISSVGAGAIGVTALLLLYPRMPTARIVGSDIAHAVPITLIAGLGHWFLGTVNIGMLLSLLVGSIPGIFIGSAAAVRFPERTVRFILAALLIAVGVKLAVDIAS